MDRVGAAAFRDVQDLGNVEIGLRSSGRADRVGLISHQDMQRGAIYVGIQPATEGIPRSRQARMHPHRDFPLDFGEVATRRIFR